MGLFIFTHIQPDISQKQWEPVYNESLEILNKFPIPLLRYSIETINESKRRVFTTDLVANRGTEDEYWYIFGDGYSHQRAEDFRLHKYIKEYMPDGRTEYKGHILDVDFDEAGYADILNGETVFDSKTQGYPYHLAVLAVGILLENRFPGKAYMSGDIDLSQVDRTIEWMNTVLSQKVHPPLCCDAGALYQSLSEIYPDKTKALSVCYERYRGDIDTWLTSIMKVESWDTMIDFYGDKLTKSTPDTWGASDVINPLIQYVDDPVILIKIFERANELIKAKNTEDKKDKLYDIKGLLKTYVSLFVTFTEAEKEPLYIYTSSSYNLHTIEDAFDNLLMRFSGRPEFVNVYIPKDKLLDIFASQQPESKDSFAEIIEKEEEECREAIKKAKDLEKEIAEKAKDKEKADAEKEEKKKKYEDRNLTLIKQENKYTEPELYIIEQTFKQKARFGNPEKSAETICEQVIELLENDRERGDDTFFNKTADQLREIIYRGSDQIGFGLTDRTWKKIDEEENLDVLTVIAVLASIRKDTKSFWDWRYFFFEHDYLWKYFVLNKKIDDSNENKELNE